MRVLILGGTGEGRVLAESLARVPGLDVISSLAGRLAGPRLPAGDVRVGGFDGVVGLADYLTGERVRAVVDATHPFATQITGHSAAACARVGLPMLVLRRPGWTAGPGDSWQRVPDLPSAAAAVAGAPPGVVLLTIGRRGPAAFAGDDAHHFVIRCVDPPAGELLPPRRTVVLARGPFLMDAERDLLRRHGVTLLVTKDSGGAATVAKLGAARELGVRVVMVDRPAPPPGVPVVSDVDAAERWVLARRAEQRGPS